METANNGEVAINIFKSISKKPDIILMDYRMPIKNGLDTAKEILDLERKTKIIFPNVDKSIKEKALMIGVFRFIKKPFTTEKLNRSIDDAFISSNKANNNLF